MNGMERRDTETERKRETDRQRQMEREREREREREKGCVLVGVICTLSWDVVT